MATTFTYPGVYIQEFTPGVPIQGVGTSTAAFIGTAASGPINQPTRLTSFDAFQSLFGDFITSGAVTYLPAAVFGFFLNGGTTCYVLRAGTGVQATQNLLTRQAVQQPDLVATAIQEGVGGNSISVTVTDSSRLASQLAAAGAGTTTLTVAQANTNIVGFDPTATTMTAGSNAGFVVGDRIQMKKGAKVVTAVISSTQGTNQILLAAPVSGASGLVNGTVRTDDLRPGDLTFRVVVPNGLVLSQALPAGALIRITLRATEDVTVASAGGNTITLATGLANTYSMAGPSFPVVASLEFDLAITNSATGKSETWLQLSMNPLHPGFWSTAVQSKLITLALPPSPPTGPLPDPRPADAAYNLAGGKDDDRTTAHADIIANPDKYLDKLKPLTDIDIVAIPGITDTNPQTALIAHCESTFNRFAVLDGVLNDSTGFPGLVAQFGQVRSPHGFAALYFPWIQVVNPKTGLNEFWPPSGHIMGIYAQTDQSRGVYKAPANVPIAGALGLKYVLTDADQGPLNILGVTSGGGGGVNILRSFREQTQPLVWGARTTSTDPNWQYVNIRRSFIFYEQSILQAMHGVVFEVNNPLLWGKLKRSITEFLDRVKGDGGIIDFYVRIDAALNPPATQALGQLFVEVGIQPAYPAEFIILRIGIWQGGSSISER
jgi:phage tail sheath protein FI